MGNMLDMSLHEYAEVGDINGIKSYIRRGGNVMKRDFYDNTALHRAASMGYTTITQYLLQQGAVVDAVAKDGWTPLHLACRWGRVDVVRLLVDAGADVSKKTKDGRTPGELMKVELQEYDRNAMAKLLGKRGIGG
ncbi:unnamed protein product [Choristocarpus tenellus]